MVCELTASGARVCKSKGVFVELRDYDLGLEDPSLAETLSVDTSVQPRSLASYSIGRKIGPLADVSIGATVVIDQDGTKKDLGQYVNQLWDRTTKMSCEVFMQLLDIYRYYREKFDLSNFTLAEMMITAKQARLISA